MDKLIENSLTYRKYLPKHFHLLFSLFMFAFHSN